MLNRLILTIVVVSLTGCASIPDFGDMSDTPEAFRAEIAAAKDYPAVSSAPNLPTDTRSKAQWDRDAEALLANKAVFQDVEGAEPRTAAEVQAKRARLSATVNAYKLDDPE